MKSTCSNSNNWISDRVGIKAIYEYISGFCHVHIRWKLPWLLCLFMYLNKVHSELTPLNIHINSSPVHVDQALKVTNNNSDRHYIYINTIHWSIIRHLISYQCICIRRCVQYTLSDNRICGLQYDGNKASPSMYIFLNVQESEKLPHLFR